MTEEVSRRRGVIPRGSQDRKYGCRRAGRACRAAKQSKLQSGSGMLWAPRQRLPGEQPDPGGVAERNATASRTQENALISCHEIPPHIQDTQKVRDPAGGEQRGGAEPPPTAKDLARDPRMPSYRHLRHGRRRVWGELPCDRQDETLLRSRATTAVVKGVNNAGQQIGQAVPIHRGQT